MTTPPQALPPSYADLVARIAALETALLRVDITVGELHDENLRLRHRLDRMEVPQ
jgi:hypothetical protein